MGSGDEPEAGAVTDIRTDIAAERATLGMALAGFDVDEVTKVLDAEAFYQPRHSEIWTAILRVRDLGDPVEPHTVVRELAKAGSKIEPTYITDLYGEAPIAGDPAWYAGRVADEAKFRALAEAAGQITLAVRDRGLEIGQVRDIARTAIDAATAGKENRTHARVAEILPAVLDKADKPGNSPVLSTPWPDVDRFIGGLAPGRLVVVGARPAVGKSLMGTNLAMHFADHHGHAVLIASMEMDREEVMQRLLASRARVDLGRIIEGEVTDGEWDEINRLHNQLMDLPIYIDDTPSQTVASIRAVARNIQRERDDLAVIVVDYLQLMGTPEVSSKANRAEAVGAISRGLKVLARETGACVVAMAQVNREGVKGGVRPTMGDLRESGAIEADANQVILLHRPNKALPELEVIVDKNRHGASGIATLRLRGHYATLSNIARTA